MQFCNASVEDCFMHCVTLLILCSVTTTGSQGNRGMLSPDCFCILFILFSRILEILSLPSIDLSEMFSFSNSFIFEGLLLFWDNCLPYSLPLYIPASISQVVGLQACAVVIPSFNLFLSFLSYFILCISVFKIT